MSCFETSQAALALGDYPRAIDHAAESARVFHEQQDGRREAVAINNIGLARLYRGEGARSRADTRSS